MERFLSEFNIQEDVFWERFREVFGEELTEHAINRANFFNYSLPYVLSKQKINSSLKHFSLSGYAGSGKSTIANILVKTFDYKELSFSDALKDISFQLTGIPRDILQGHTVESRRLREQPFELSSSLTVVPREILQKLGTEVFRSLNENIWIDIVIRQIKGSSQPVVVSDARFLNELTALKMNGVIAINVIRNRSSSKHISETEHTKFIHYDFVIVNDFNSINELYMHLKSDLELIKDFADDDEDELYKDLKIMKTYQYDNLNLLECIVLFIFSFINFSSPPLYRFLVPWSTIDRFSLRQLVKEKIFGKQ